MSRHRFPVRRIACAALTLWLGLWPAADAVTGVTQVVVVEPATADAGERCRLPDSIIEQAAATGCCALAEAFDAAASDCCESKQSRCCRCYTLGGMVLFAVAQWSLDPHQVDRGAVSAAAIFKPSRHLQPPVPPPWSLS